MPVLKLKRWLWWHHECPTPVNPDDDRRVAKPEWNTDAGEAGAWTISFSNGRHSFDTIVEVKACPLCGESLPEKPAKAPKPAAPATDYQTMVRMLVRANADYTHGPIDQAPFAGWFEIDVWLDSAHTESALFLFRPDGSLESAG